MRFDVRVRLLASLCLAFGLAAAIAAQSADGTGSSDGVGADSANGAPGQGGAGSDSSAGGPSFSGDARSIFAQAENLRFSEDWYGAVEGYLAVLELNPHYGEALAGLAECYYELEQYDQALSYARRAAPFLRGDPRLADLEGFIRVGLADLA